MLGFTVKRVVGAGILACAYLTKRRLDRRLKLAAEYEEDFRKAGPLVSHAILSDLDLPDEDLPFDLPVVTRDILPRIVRLSVSAIRAEIGWLREDSLGANRLVVDRCFRKYAEGRGMRPSHIARFAGIVVEVYFLPTEDDVLAKAVRAHPLAAAARGRYAQVANPSLGWVEHAWRATGRCVSSVLRFGATAVLERLPGLDDARAPEPGAGAGVGVLMEAPAGPGLEPEINAV